jgi:quercetin dioxygenase-like cupin family protein
MSHAFEIGTGETERTIDDQTTGERITFLETSREAAESGEDRVVMRIVFAPGTSVPPHAHPFAEAFECLEGKFVFQLDGRSLEVRPGSTVTAARNQVHGIQNTSQEPAEVQVVAMPGGIAEHSLRLKFLLSRDGYLPTGGGRPKHLLLAAVVLHRSGMYFPPLPAWLFRPLIAALAALGRWRGREDFLLRNYPEYGRLLESLGKR